MQHTSPVHAISRLVTAVLIITGLMLGGTAHDAFAGAPTAPEIISIKPTGPHTVTVQFRDNAVDEEAFNLIYGPSDDAMNERMDDLHALPGVRRVSVVYVKNLMPNTKYCFMMEAWNWHGGVFGKKKVWSDVPSATKCATTPAEGGAPAPPPPAPAPAPPPPAPLPAMPARPSGFHGERDGARIVLGWDDSPDEDYYFLTATSVDGNVPQRLSDPAPKLGQDGTAFIEEGNAANVVGGISFALQACNPGGCSPKAIVTVK